MRGLAACGSPPHHLSARLGLNCAHACCTPRDSYDRVLLVARIGFGSRVLLLAELEVVTSLAAFSSLLQTATYARATALDGNYSNSRPSPEMFAVRDTSLIPALYLSDQRLLQPLSQDHGYVHEDLLWEVADLQILARARVGLVARPRMLLSG